MEALRYQSLLSLQDWRLTGTCTSVRTQTHPWSRNMSRRGTRNRRSRLRTATAILRRGKFSAKIWPQNKETLDVNMSNILDLVQNSHHYNKNKYFEFNLAIQKYNNGETLTSTCSLQRREPIAISRTVSHDRRHQTRVCGRKL